MRSLNEEIILLKERLVPFMEQEVYKPKSNSLKTFLEKEDQDQKLKKKKRYNPDFLDYSNKMVFKWQAKVDEPMEALPGSSSSLGTCTLLPVPLTQIPHHSVVDSSIRATGQRNQYPSHTLSGYTMGKPKKSKNKARKIVSQPIRNNDHYREDTNSYVPRGGAPPHYDNDRAYYEQADHRDTHRSPYRDHKWHVQTRCDPRDSYNRPSGYTPRDNHIPIYNRFTPLVHHQRDRPEDEPVISRHPSDTGKIMIHHPILKEMKQHVFFPGPLRDP